MNVQNAFIQVPTAIFWKDIHSRYQGCNEYMAKQAGLFSPEEIIGKTDDELVWSKNASLYQMGDKKVLCGVKRLNVLEPFINANNKKCVIMTNKAPMFDGDGNIIGIIGNYCDIFNICDDTENEHSQKQTPKLTFKQIEILSLLASGMPNKLIARKLLVSPRTIEHHVNILKVKFKCASKFHLIKKAIESDVIKAQVLRLLTTMI